MTPQVHPPIPSSDCDSKLTSLVSLPDYSKVEYGSFPSEGVGETDGIFYQYQTYPHMYYDSPITYESSHDSSSHDGDLLLVSLQRGSVE